MRIQPDCLVCQHIGIVNHFAINIGMEDYPFLTAAIANVITRLREDAGLSKRKLSQISGIDRVYILQIEQGKYRPTVNFMFLMAKGLGIPAAELFSLVEKELVSLQEKQSWG